tara:strand:+ start:345 stop:479 length:135 start_codon:yes stop_codon:yes gene_type:complete
MALSCKEHILAMRKIRKIIDEGYDDSETLDAVYEVLGKFKGVID